MQSSDLSNYTKEQLAEALRQKGFFGLVFKQYHDESDQRLLSGIPHLVADNSRNIRTGERERERDGSPVHSPSHSPENLLIEGDNLHVLSILQYTHKGKIDVIYIDPPYNRGKNDLVYDDDFTDKSDASRHSKWLSFMEKRLILARNLLSESGVIFMSIDDNEYAHLKTICDQVF